MRKGEGSVRSAEGERILPSRVFVVSGPSGAGKTSLCSEVLNRLPWLRESISHTTRGPRPGEKEGREYFFVDRATFEHMIQEGQFLEWEEVHGHLYGSSLANLKGGSEEKDLLFEVDCSGARKIRDRIKGAVLIFVMTPSLADLTSRIQKRGSISEKDLGVRLQTARYEIQQVPFYDYLVINDEFDDAVDQLRSILVSERSRRESYAGFWVDKWTRELDDLLNNAL